MRSLHDIHRDLISEFVERNHPNGYFKIREMVIILIWVGEQNVKFRSDVRGKKYFTRGN